MVNPGLLSGALDLLVKILRNEGMRRSRAMIYMHVDMTRNFEEGSKYLGRMPKGEGML